MKIKNLIIIIFLITATTIVSAQKLEIGAGLGGTNSRTDISHINPLNTRYGLSAFGRWNFDETWVFRLDYKFINIFASDANNNSSLAKERNHSFSNNIHELSGNLEYNFLNFRSVNKQVKWSPYLTAGLGVFQFEDYSAGSGIGKFNVGIPFGGGMKYMLSKTWNLGMLFQATKTFTDQLDNLDRSQPSSIATQSKSVDESTNDWYFYLGFSVSYTLYPIKCPEFYEIEN